MGNTMKILLCHNYYQRPGGEDQVFHDERWLLEEHGRLKVLDEVVSADNRFVVAVCSR